MKLVMMPPGEAAAVPTDPHWKLRNEFAVTV